MTNIDRLPNPMAAGDSRGVLADAIEILGRIRGFGPLDTAARVHLLASLILQAEARLAWEIPHLHDTGYSWKAIAKLTGKAEGDVVDRFGELVMQSTSWSQTRK